MSLTFKEYQEEAKKTEQFTHPDTVTYCVLGISGEAGEIAEKRKKQLRGDPNTPSTEDIVSEMGDVLWYLSALAGELGVSLEEVARSNITKIQSRQKRGLVKGSGDRR